MTEDDEKRYNNFFIKNGFEEDSIRSVLIQALEVQDIIVTIQKQEITPESLRACHRLKDIFIVLHAAAYAIKDRVNQLKEDFEQY